MSGLRCMALLVALLLVPPAAAERLASTLSNENVSITSSFAGETLMLSGNIEADIGGALGGPYDVVIVITGPLVDRVARRKTNVLGVWINTQQVEFDAFPSYFHVLSNRRLDTITDGATLAVERILPDAQAANSAQQAWWNTAVFGHELVRLMTERGLFGLDEAAVEMHSPSFYSARLTLPTDVPNGSFLATTYVFENGEIVARRAEGFRVQKIAFERFLANSARDYPLFYGIACVVLAIGTGWLGGIIFKR